MKRYPRSTPAEAEAREDTVAKLLLADHVTEQEGIVVQVGGLEQALGLYDLNQFTPAT